MKPGWWWPTRMTARLAHYRRANGSALCGAVADSWWRRMKRFELGKCLRCEKAQPASRHRGTKEGK